MSGYSEEFKELVRDSNDIVDVISKYVPLKRRGKIFFGVCPFHSEKTASFSVRPDSQFFYCFGCHTGGDVFTFISKIENISFKESIEFLAKRANIELPSTLDSDSPREKQKKRMYEMHLDAASFYHERLYGNNAKIAQDYVKKRKLNNNTLKTFKIGYSGVKNELYKYLVSKGYTDKEIESANLCYKLDDGEHLDKFRNRLMFPIIDTSGRVIAFGGRRLLDNDKSAKYLNSNESLIFSKKNNLYNLNLAKKSGEKTLILVEGYMDVISLYQRGIKNVVASLGTSLTEEQGKLIRRYMDTLVLSYDSDEAGQTAIERGLDVLEKVDVEGKVLQMEEDLDPDEYIIKYGSERFKLLVQNAISSIDFKTKRLRKIYDIDNTSDKIKFLKEVAKLIANIDSDIEREVYIKNIAQSNNISEEAIYSEVNKLLYKGKSNYKVERATNNVSNVKSIGLADEKQVDDAEQEREKMILYYLIKEFDDISKKIFSNFNDDDFLVEKYKIVYSKILSTKTLDVLNSEDESIQNTLGEIMLSDYNVNSVDKFVDDVIFKNKKDRLNRRKEEILNTIKLKEISKEEIDKLENELNDIITELAKIK